MRQSFVHNGAPKYNGELSSLSGWFTTPQGSYVLGWELAQFDSAVDDVFGFRAVQVGLPEVDFLRQNRINFRFSVAHEPGAGNIRFALCQLPSLGMYQVGRLTKNQELVEGIYT